MNIARLRDIGDGEHKFDLGVGGFVIANCKWRPSTGYIQLPRVRLRSERWRPVARMYGKRVQTLQLMLSTGQLQGKRDRRPRVFKIHNMQRRGDWWEFDFTVRGVVICGSRWQPYSGSIQLPVAWYGYDSKFPLVQAAGAHIVALRNALEVTLT